MTLPYCFRRFQFKIGVRDIIYSAVHDDMRDDYSYGVGVVQRHTYDLFFDHSYIHKVRQFRDNRMYWYCSDSKLRFCVGH